MASRSGSLKKIEKLYGLIENMHALALQQAAALVHEAEAAIQVQGTMMRAARADAHAAMAVGNRAEYAVADLQQTVSGQRRDQLEALRRVREAAAEQACAVYDASRIERGQIKAVVDRAAAAERLVEARRTQAISDDRFLSRQSWNRLQDGTA